MIVLLVYWCLYLPIGVVGGSVGVISTSRDDWNDSTDSSVRVEEEEPAVFVRVKGKQDEEDTLSSDKSSQADWIRQYMMRQEEVLI